MSKYQVQSEGTENLQSITNTPTKINEYYKCYITKTNVGKYEYNTMKTNLKYDYCHTNIIGCGYRSVKK